MPFVDFLFQQHLYGHCVPFKVWRALSYSTELSCRGQYTSVTCAHVHAPFSSCVHIDVGNHAGVQLISTTCVHIARQVCKMPEQFSNSLNQHAKLYAVGATGSLWFDPCSCLQLGSKVLTPFKSCEHPLHQAVAFSFWAASLQDLNSLLHSSVCLSSMDSSTFGLIAACSLFVHLRSDVNAQVA